MGPSMDVRDLDFHAEALHRQMAELLVAGFRRHWPAAWPTLAEALAEVREFCTPERLCRLAVAETPAGPRVLGWIGGLPEYDGHVWELHPLVVDPAHQRHGIGRALVQDLEAQVRARGGLTVQLGSDDEAGLTSLAGRDLYPDLLGQLAGLRNLAGHPFEFYQKLGYTVTGVVPDANGWGRPDILMAKRVAPPPAGVFEAAP